MVALAVEETEEALSKQPLVGHLDRAMLVVMEGQILR
jgi:hypothetical protein